MTPELTRFGEEMSHLTGVRAIMKDIIETLTLGQGQQFINLSAGNPVILPEIEQLWRDCTQELLASPEYGHVVCRYGTSQGYEPLIAAIIEGFSWLRLACNACQSRVSRVNDPCFVSQPGLGDMALPT
jgi:valine--pyruvate aminotransferase